MRSGLFAPLLLLVACASDNHLIPGLQDELAPDPTDPVQTGTVPQEDPELASLAGTVCAPDGETTIAHASVTVHHFQDSTAETNGRGKFQLVDLPPGTWDVEIRKGSFVTVLPVELVAGKVTQLSVDECTPLEQGDTKIAVVTGMYDDIGALLDELNFDYDRINGKAGTDLSDFLTDRNRLVKYDVIFFNCGMTDNWQQHQGDVVDNLRDYVRQGGSVYASDWAHWLVEKGWPSEHDFHGGDQRQAEALVGAAGEVQATVLDRAMVEALGEDEADLNYDLDSWATMDAAPGAEVLIRGEYKWWRGFSKQTASGPLATRLEDGDGQVLFTTFHNERQSTNDMLTLLEEIILSL